MQHIDRRAVHHRVGTGLTKDERRLVNDRIKDLLQERRPSWRRCNLLTSKSVFGILSSK
jgi:hypothetical protein